jgi:hypothetical protein
MSDAGESDRDRLTLSGRFRIFMAVFGSFSSSAIAAAEALNAHPLNQTAARYRTAAFCLFVAFAGLILSAAIVHVSGSPILSEALGWGGIALLCACVACGLCYRSVNVADDDDPRP